MTPTFFALIVLLAGLFASRAGVLYWQMVFCLFGAAAAITLPALGGAVITPAVLFMPFVVLRACVENYGHNYVRRIPTAGVWLALAVLCGLLGAMVMPRMLAGAIEILTIDRNSSSEATAVLMPMRPVSGNITQSGYALGAVAAFLSLRALLEKPGRLEHFRDAVLLLASLNCAAAALNLAEFYLGFPPLLTYVRTAYAVFDAYEGAGGLMRIHGTFPEASSFASFSLPLFAFTFSLWLHDIRSHYSGVLWVVLLILLLISTSTTAYVGLAVYAASLAFILTYRGYVRGTVPRLGLLIAGSLLMLVVVGSVFVLETDLGKRLQDYFEITVFAKLESESGVERSSWNRHAWLNFLDTYGIGVGLGTARASSLPLVLLSNLGLLGTLFYFAFLKRLFGSRADIQAELAPVPEAARQAVLGALATGLASCTVFDLGVGFYAYAAAASITPTLLRDRITARASPNARLDGGMAMNTAARFHRAHGAVWLALIAWALVPARVHADPASPWGVAPSAALSYAPVGWAKDMARAGVTWVRGFDDGRGRAGADEIAATGLALSGILIWSPSSELTFPMDDLEGFRRHVVEHVTRYKGLVRHFEVWNEPPNFTRDGSPASYAKLVAIAYDAAKSVDPNVQIGLAAKSTHVSFLAATIDAGARGNFDYITLHPYETATLVPQGWEGPFLGIVPSVRAMLRDKAPERAGAPVWFTEIGLEAKDGISEELQADTLVKLYAMSLAQGAAHVHWFDPQDSEGKAHGLLLGDGSPRPAHHALATLIRLLGRHPVYRGSIRVAPDTFGFLFEGEHQDAVVLTWSRGPRSTAKLGSDATIVTPRTGESRSAASLEVTRSPIALVAARDQPLARAWYKAAQPGAPTWDGGKLGRKVALNAGRRPQGLHLIDAPAATMVNGVPELDLSGRSEARFAVDPLFLGYESQPIRITAVVRPHGRGKAGFNLKYETSADLSRADDYGMVGAGPWTTLEGTGTKTLRWEIRDARFVGKYGTNFAIDCDSPEFSNFSLVSISVSKL